MERIQVIANIVQRLEVTCEDINDKLDIIVERNHIADKAIDVIRNNQEHHDHNDAREFSDIKNMFLDVKKKHDSYDNFIRGLLIFAITQLIVIIVVIMEMT